LINITIIRNFQSIIECTKEVLVHSTIPLHGIDKAPTVIEKNRFL
jgi:hypothetical protein